MMENVNYKEFVRKTVNEAVTTLLSVRKNGIINGEESITNLVKNTKEIIVDYADYLSKRGGINDLSIHLDYMYEKISKWKTCDYNSLVRIQKITTI